MPVFYVVATPIGNLEDITLRAIAVLSSVDVVLCEDTRVTGILMKRYNINTPLLSYHAHSNEKKVQAVCKLLEQGKSVALVSDAGTPGISDPGTGLVAAIRALLPQVNVVAVPGPSALIAALSISGLPSSEFVFLGFVPHKKGRNKLFTEIAESKRTVVCYESPHRIIKTLTSLAQLLESSRHVVVGRELTKHFEEAVTGSISEVLRYFETHTDKQRGEFVIIIGP